MTNKDILNFLFEMAQMRFLKRSGWRLIQMDNPENVAEHSLRAAQLGYILAKMEQFEDPHKISSLMIFHELEECRYGDIDKLSNRYLAQDKQVAVKEQTQNLSLLGEDLFSLWNEVEQSDTKAGKIAQDADKLELSITAREFMEKGYKEAVEWFEKTGEVLTTGSAKALHSELRNADPTEWWKGLKKFD